MRDPAVLAIFALRITAAEHERIAAGLPIVRPFWPPARCRASVVGLQVTDVVVGEALLVSAVATDGGAAWTFGPVVLYRRPLPHPAPRGMSSPMPAAHFDILACMPYVVLNTVNPSAERYGLAFFV